MMGKYQIKRFLSDDSGSTAVEYALIAGLICLGTVASIDTVSDGLMGLYDLIQAALERANS